MFTFTIEDGLLLELQKPEHDYDLFRVVSENRDYIGAQLAWAKRIQTIADMRFFMERDLNGMAEERRWSFAIRYQGTIVGRIGIFVTIPAVKECELHYWLAESATGKGIVTKAARTMIDFAFQDLGMNHVLIGFAHDNIKSQKVAERLGLQYECSLREAEHSPQGYHDLHFYGVLAADWQAQSQPIFAYPVSAKLELRLQEIRHAEQNHRFMQRYLNDFRQWFAWLNEDYSVEDESAYLYDALSNYAIGKALNTGIFYEGQLIGLVSLSINRHQGEVGYCLDSAYRGQGIMKQCLQALFRYAFDEIGLERLICKIASENTASRRLVERLGMVQEALLRDEQFVNGRYLSHYVYSLLHTEF